MLVDGLTDISNGCRPTVIVAVTLFVLPSITETVLSSQLVT